MLEGLRSRWFRAILSLGIAIFLWFSVKLLGSYHTLLVLPATYYGLPPNLRLVRPLPPVYRVSVVGVGHQLFLPSLRGHLDTLRIDVAPSLKTGTMSAAQVSAHLAQELPPSVRVEQVQPEQVPLVLQAKLAKRVPVVSRVHINPQDGYLLTAPAQFSPDSVTLLGTAQELAKYNAWPTQLKELNGITEPVEQPVSMASLPGITVVPSQVRLTALIQQFTENTVLVPIQKIHLSVNEQVRLQPESIQVRYLVPFNKYEQVSPADFTLQLDFSQVNPQDQLLIPTLVHQPGFVRIVRLEPPYVSYVLSSRSGN